MPGILRSGLAKGSGLQSNVVLEEQPLIKTPLGWPGAEEERLELFSFWVVTGSGAFRKVDLRGSIDEQFSGMAGH